MAKKNASKAKAAAAAPPVLKAQGAAGGKKRTPQSSFDAAAGNDTYEPEKIVAQRCSKGVSQWLVKWVGWESKHNTWEPIENLAGCEDMIADFNGRRKQLEAEAEAAAEAKKIEKQEAESARAAKQAADAAAARTNRR